MAGRKEGLMAAVSCGFATDCWDVHQPHAGRRLSVGTHLAIAFTVCFLGVAAVLAAATVSSFERERSRAVQLLRAAAEQDAGWADETAPDVLELLEGLATQEGITALDGQQCEAVLSGLASLRSAGHVHLLRADGTQVCSLQDPALPDRPVEWGDWFRQVLDRDEPVDGGTGLDSLSGRPSTTTGIPVEGRNGEKAVLALVAYTAPAPLELPPAAPDGSVLIELDPARQLVLATSDDAGLDAGSPTPEWARGPFPAGGRTVTDARGRQWLYVEATAPTSGWHVLAGVPRGTALAAAQRDLRRNVAVSAVVLAALVALGATLHHRLARPVRTLRRAIEAAASDSAARAPAGGPAEVAALAGAFNETIGRREVLERALAHQASHDHLTGLPNRVRLAHELEDCLRRSPQSGSVAVGFLDLDRFKLINDSMGHPAGDIVLTTLADRLRSAAHPGELVARFGGDEFVIVSTGRFSERDAAGLAARFAAVLDEPFVIGAHDVVLSGSIGIALNEPGDDPDELLRNADSAMYAAKERDPGGFTLYRAPLHQGIVTRLEIERELRQAIDNGEFTVHYQPTFDLRSGSAVAVEALARWNHPTRGLVPPAEFIPVGEDTGLIIPIGKLVLHKALEQAARWHASGLDVAVAVNLSARQLARPDLITTINEVLTATGADPKRLTVEVTETTLLGDLSGAVNLLRALRALGVKVALDDFGTGYSSLAYLRLLPIDEVKLDRSFVTDVADNGPAAAVVAGVVTLAHALDLSVVAEGIETAEQHAALRTLGCDIGQGFHLARPAPAELIEPVLRAKTLTPLSPALSPL
jgi:diguanylate cyclase (GGDEF)-like protein